MAESGIPTSGASDTANASTNGLSRVGGTHLFTKETAAEFGRRGGLRSGQRRGKKTLEELHKSKDELYNRLWEAAFGVGSFSDLPSDKQLAALKLLLERIEGRPATKASNNEQPEQADDGWEIGVAES